MGLVSATCGLDNFVPYSSTSTPARPQPCACCGLREKNYYRNHVRSDSSTVITHSIGPAPFLPDLNLGGTPEAQMIVPSSEGTQEQREEGGGGEEEEEESSPNPQSRFRE